MKSRLLTGFPVLLVPSSCYLPMSGGVIDAVTQQPIAGAVVLVE